MMIAEKIIRSTYTTEPGVYLGECDSKESAYQMSGGLFVEGIDNETYLRYIKENGLVKLMAGYWDQVISSLEQEKLI